MHLWSRIAQKVFIEAAGITVEFEEGETIWTESSHKYCLPQIATMAAATGFTSPALWIDTEWGLRRICGWHSELMRNCGAAEAFSSN